jgi:hypothetical protein
MLKIINSKMKIKMWYDGVVRLISTHFMIDRTARMILIGCSWFEQNIRQSGAVNCIGTITNVSIDFSWLVLPRRLMVLLLSIQRCRWMVFRLLEYVNGSTACIWTVGTRATVQCKRFQIESWITDGGTRTINRDAAPQKSVPTFATGISQKELHPHLIIYAAHHHHI